MSLAFFPMFPDDFEADTAHLSLAEDGAYNRLLRLCWRTAGCSVPSDESWIMRKMRARTDEEKDVVRIVLDEFFVKENGRVLNPRLMKEWVSANEAHERRVSAGSRGGSAKALKSNEPPPSNAVAKPKQPEPQPEPHIASATAAAIGPQPQWDADRLHSELLSAAGLNMGRIPTHWLPPAASMHVWRWHTELGLPPERIIEAVRASRSQHSEAPTGPKAYDRVMKGLSGEMQAPSMGQAVEDKRARWKKLAGGAA